MAKVMLVEDDPTMISLLETLLQIEGYDVEKIVDFENVVGAIENAKPNIVLMDVHLEDQDGIALLVETRSRANLNHVQIIMSSGMDFRHECMTKGANEFLLKPYMPDELIDKIKKLLS